MYPMIHLILNYLMYHLIHLILNYQKIHLYPKTLMSRMIPTHQQPNGCQTIMVPRPSAVRAMRLVVLRNSDAALLNLRLVCHARLRWYLFRVAYKVNHNYCRRRLNGFRPSFSSGGSSPSPPNAFAFFSSENSGSRRSSNCQVPTSSEGLRMSDASG